MINNSRSMSKPCSEHLPEKKKPGPPVRKRAVSHPDQEKEEKDEAVVMFDLRNSKKSNLNKFAIVQRSLWVN
ncbi:hypothetical protein [Taibaiella chishuiensis]|uniref:hypothetical protein n=1 Tax=Taibaiella chishuiensis TaxID=1434707 RepID=UPI0011B24496|nr:hypothetical protein [Taibaiella chishuiensis]